MQQSEVQVVVTQSGGKPTWGGCAVPFLVGVLVLSLVVYGLMALRRRSMSADDHIRTAWLEPWADAVRRDDLASVWERLTTDNYRRNNNLDAVRTTWRTAVQRWGPPTEVSLWAANGAADLASGRRYTRAISVWSWTRGRSFNITFELVESPAGTFRLDRTQLGGRREYPVPNDAPDGPW